MVLIGYFVLRRSAGVQKPKTETFAKTNLNLKTFVSRHSRGGGNLGKFSQAIEIKHQLILKDKIPAYMGITI